MKNIVLVTHADFAKGILTSLQLVMGKSENISYVSISAKETIPEIAAMIESCIEEFGNGAPTVILTDIAGGSTTQAAMQVLERRSKSVYLLTGLNLGLLLAVALAPIGENAGENSRMLKEILEESRQSMNFVNDMLEETEAGTENGDSGEL